jgi:hypothetical protein
MLRRAPPSSKCGSVIESERQCESISKLPLVSYLLSTRVVSGRGVVHLVRVLLAQQRVLGPRRLEVHVAPVALSDLLRLAVRRTAGG